jgi:glyoxylate/hydroxypyruvate reductase A
MTVNVLYAADPSEWDDYRPALIDALREAGVDARLTNQPGNPREVDYIVFSPGGTISDFSGYTRAKAILNLWAGVERVVGNPTLTQPLARMVDPEMTESMVEWVVGHTLRHHLGMDRHILGQDGIWRNGSVPPIARERPVTILGLGELGQAVAQALLALNFPVRGWSRTPKDVAGVTCFSGETEIDKALAGAEIVILLLPRTEDTANTMNARRLSLLAAGAVVINPGRGTLIDDEALLDALNSGHIGHATLDVFRVEPLPPDHAFWHHPKVTVTPHVAAQTRHASASRVIAENIRRGEAGEPFLYLVDRKRGY